MSMSKQMTIDEAHELALNMQQILRCLPGVGCFRSEQARADYFLS